MALQEMGYSTIKTSILAELAIYHHQTLCSRPKSTLLKAITNFQLKSCPGLTYELIKKHLPPSTASHKGHMVWTRKNSQSTRSNQKEITDARLAVDDMNPLHQICTAIDNEISCFMALWMPWQYHIRRFVRAVPSAILCRKSVYFHCIYLYDQCDINEANEKNGWWKYDSNLQRNLRKIRDIKLQTKIVCFRQPMFESSQIIHTKREDQYPTRQSL